CDLVTELAHEGTTTIVVSERATRYGAIAFTCATEGVTDSFRRLLMVAARLFGSSLERARRAEIADGELAALRALSFGSARHFLGSSPCARQLAERIPRL